MKDAKMGTGTVSALIFVLLAVGCSKGDPEASRQDEADKGASKGGDSTSSVRVANAEVRTINRFLEYTGTVEASRQVRMVPEITAKVAKLSVDDGDHVKKGQVLAKFDTRLYTLQKNQAKAAVKMAQTQVETAQKELTRLQPLVESGAASMQQLDQLTSGVDMAEAGKGQAQAALALASYSVKQSTLKAPFDGIVTNVLINEGEYVGPQLATYGMLTLVDISSVKVKVSVTEKDLPLVQEGMLVEVLSDSYPDQVFAAKVVMISPAADPVSKSFPVEVELPNPGEQLKSGMFVRVRIHVESADDALVVPPQSIIDLKDRKVIYVVGKDKKAHIKEVTLGIEGLDGVQIVTGDVSAQDSIVIEGNFGLKDGASVLIAE
jgi:RND family efflux transporter MFP subunit